MPAQPYVPTSSKIINDPVHGFIDIPRGLILDLIDTPVFQRLRRIKQLGQSQMVYPGGVHHRFHHVIGAMHLMRQALDTLRSKQVEISEAEYEGALVAILLHDIGHGPFSHALEYAIIREMHHEEMSLALMHHLNAQFGGKLDTAIQIFTGEYPKPFLHQLVSSQLDMDRMDYLLRDSFFTGVVEGKVGVDRIIKTLNVYNDRLVVESKGLYSAESFIHARRLMYWQVYLHKTAVSAEHMVSNILLRARELFEAGHEGLFLDAQLGYFFRHPDMPDGITTDIIERFIQLDDVTVEYHIHQWSYDRDPVLADLCRRFLERDLLKIRIQQEPIAETELEERRRKAVEALGVSPELVKYYVYAGKVSNQAYLKNDDEPVMIWFKNNELKDLATASDMQNIQALSSPVVRYFVCWPA